MRLVVRARRILAGATIAALLAVTVAGGASAYFREAPAWHWDNGALCGDLSTLSAVAPSVYGINATAGTDIQPFSWRSVLFQWNGAAWQAIVAHPWSQAVWVVDYKAVQPQNQTQTFVDFGPGYYRVAIQYYWWAYGASPAGSDYLYVGTHHPVHNGQITGSAGYCTYT